MDKTVAVKWMTLFNQKVQEERDYLSELDGPIGDGDHGANLARGMAAAVEAINASDPQSAADVLKTVSMALISKVGGASGPLYGSAFMGMMKAEQEGQDLAGVLEAGADMIEKRGHAQVGEKTMVDVWRPVLEAVKRGQLTNEVIDQAVLSTKDVVATKGRASYVGERSIGHIDPGSYSSGLLFKALLEAEEQDMTELGIVIVSHSADIAKGLVSLIREVAPNIPLTATGGLEDGGLGSSFDHVQLAVDSQPAKRLLAFYDLGSARMNLEMVEEFSEKDILIQHVPLIEGAYTASALLQAGASEVEILSQVNELTIQK